MAGGAQEGKQAKGSPKLANKRNKLRSAAWWATDRYAVNKLKRILKSEGPEAALKWAKDRGCLSSLGKLRKLAPGVYKRAVDKSEAFRKFDQGK